MLQIDQQPNGQLMIPQLLPKLQLQLHLPQMSVVTKKLCATILIGLITDAVRYLLPKIAKNAGTNNILTYSGGRKLVSFCNISTSEIGLL